MTVKADTSKGFIAGIVATLPMTIAMLIIKACLPQHEREELPPEKITKNVAKKTMHHPKPLNEPQKQQVSLLAHFLFGGLGGVAYSFFLRRIPLPPLVKGSLFGLLVWATSYQGWLPATDLHSPATREKKGRNILMIISHLIWGYSVAKLN